MNLRLRKGKGYELTVFGHLTMHGFDVYLPTVDDQAIDGVLRYRQSSGQVHYLDIQVKGAKNIRGTNIVVDKLPEDVLLLLYDAAEETIYWFLRSDIDRFFPSKGCSISDVNWNKQLIQDVERAGHADLSQLADILDLAS